MNLSQGHQKMLDICIALATQPRLLLLDEPVAGMDPSETAMMMELIRQIRDRGITVIVIEHDMNVVMNICDRVAVLNYGQKIAEGLPEEVRTNQEVIVAYLGTQKECADAA
jgi:branched-chain amino acid transport system ATP-binding protein